MGSASFWVTAFALFLTCAGVVVAFAGLYLLFLAFGALLPPKGLVPAGPHSQLLVLVPAHNECELIARSLGSLVAQDYPRGLYEIVVIADNCTDDTATIATSHGAQVLVRDCPDARGKGQALRWATDQLLRQRRDLDAVVVVDADSVCAPHLLSGLVARLEAGADAVQAEYLALREDDSARSELKAAALLLFHRVRFRGRANLGMPCHLVGNGMLFSRRLLDEHPWNAFTSTEDLEYSVDLRLAGIRPVYAPEAAVYGPMPARGRAARTQQLRWEGGRFHVVRTRLPILVGRVLRHGSWDLFDAAVDLAVPPLGLLTAIAAAGSVVSVLLAVLGVMPAWTTAPWLAASLSVAAFVLLGLRAGGAPASTFRALLVAPVFVASTLLTRLRLLGGSKATTWRRTERLSDLGGNRALPGAGPRPGPVDSRYDIGGVPVDAVDFDEAVRRTMSAVDTRSFMQICTVNLDFLVNARRDRRVRSVLTDSHLNLADGTPVVWLSKLRRHPLPGRVAGSDLIPALMSSAASRGVRVFFLGGEDGTAAAAAERLQQLHPQLQVAGVFEPPRASLEAMDNDDILRRLDEAQADVLLVALGHPKQDRWIHDQRDRLPVSVAIGVGCTFDLIAGHRQRAPEWMQRQGLEWLFRLLHEPRRLSTRYLADAWWLMVVFIPSCLVYRLSGRE
jgi:exopolysaccharide biosynthesis WecB/TagA/CpsF family protein